MIHTNDIRARYPHPVREFDYVGIYLDDEPYCIGGAVCNFVAWNERTDWMFPEVGDISGALRCINPALSEKRALYYAEWITAENDSCDYEKAWSVLARALTATH